jgi:hypothetical protein
LLPNSISAFTELHYFLTVQFYMTKVSELPRSISGMILCFNFGFVG